MRNAEVGMRNILCAAKLQRKNTCESGFQPRINKIAAGSRSHNVPYTCSFQLTGLSYFGFWNKYLVV